ncbi:MAG: hypothetical protein R3C46_11640 [Hyphomonadaceae bacterium]
MMRARLAAILLATAAAAPAIAQPPSSVVISEEPDAQAEPCQACIAESRLIQQKIDAALKAPDRPMEHRLRDDGRQIRRLIETVWPAQRMVVGSRVLDVASGGGYLALVFSSLVGETGHVDIHNTPGWIAQFPSMDPERQQGWIKRASIGWKIEPWNDLDAPPQSYDIILLGQVYHDIVLEGGDVVALNQRFFDMLTPGGRVIIEDHDAIATMPLAQQVNLHRISKGDVIGHFLEAGFTLAAEAEIESRYDDRKMNVFWPNVRGRTDRYFLVFEKPFDGNPAQ